MQSVSGKESSASPGGYAPRTPFIVLILGICLLIALGWREGVGVRGHQENLSAGANVLALGTELYASGLTRPVDIAAPNLPGEERLFVVEQSGRIRIVASDGTLLSTPFLDITDRVFFSGERGLLGLAFDPDFANNGYLYVNYTRQPDGATVISRFVAANVSTADASSEHILLSVPQPYSNHNGGDLAFGPDGYLYIPLGDGGSAGDPQDRAQDLSLLLGKLVRINVNPSGGNPPDCGGTGASYSIPADNPLADGPGKHCDEIWAYGLRNPWRFSFDRHNGDIFIGDVGQGGREEIDLQASDSSGGENYGWRCYEGTSIYNDASCSGNAADFTFPIFEYSHGTPSSHCSVTGGYVYRGGQFPTLNGRYLFADFCSGNLWSLIDQGAGSWQAISHGAVVANPSTFGESRDGELFIASISEGRIYRIALVNRDFIYLPIVFAPSGPES